MGQRRDYILVMFSVLQELLSSLYKIIKQPTMLCTLELLPHSYIYIYVCISVYKYCICISTLLAL